MRKILLIISLILLPTVSQAQSLQNLECPTCFTTGISSNQKIIPNEYKEAYAICNYHKIYDNFSYTTYPGQPAYHYENGYEECVKLEDKIDNYNNQKSIQKQKDIDIIEKAIQ